MLVIFAFQCAQAQNPEQAKQLIVAEKFSEAQAVLNALKGNAEHATLVNYYLGVIAMKTGEAETAKNYFAQIPEEQKDYTSLLSRGRIALLNKDVVNAKLLLDKAVAVTKNKNAEVMYEVGDAYVMPNPVSLSEAIGYLESAVALSPQNPAYYLRLGDAYLANKEDGKALSQYENVVSYNDKLSVAWLKMARINSNGHLFDASCNNYEKFLSLEPNHPTAWKEYGENLYHAGRFTEVEKAFEKHVEINNNDKEARMAICILKFTYKKYEEAIECSQNYLAVTKDTTNYVAWRIISWSNYELKNYQAGYDAVMKFWGIEEKKTNATDYIYSARLAAQMKDTVRTMFFFDEALQSDSASADLYTEYGKTLFSMRKYQDAAKTFEEKNIKYGNGAIDVFYLGRAYFLVPDYKKADSSFAVFIEKQPTSLDGYLWRAKSNVRIDSTGTEGLAFPYYQKFIELASADTVKNKATLVEAYGYMIGYYYGKLDNKTAKEYLNKALELDPANEFALEMKGIIN